MIDRIIEFSGRNKFAVFLLVGFAAVAGWWSMEHVPLDAIPDLSDTQVIIYSRWDRSPDIVEDQVTYPIVTAHARRAARQSRPRLLRFRLLLRLRHLRRRHGHLLGAVAHPRIPLERAAAPAAGRQYRARPGRNRRRLGLPVRAGRYDRQTRPRGAAIAPGLVPSLPPQGRPRRGRGRAARRLRPPVPGQRRSEPAAGLQHPDQQSGRGRAAGEQRRRRPADRVHRRRVHGARARLRPLARRTSATSCSRRA